MIVMMLVMIIIIVLITAAVTVAIVILEKLLVLPIIIILKGIEMLVYLLVDQWVISIKVDRRTDLFFDTAGYSGDNYPDDQEKTNRQEKWKSICQEVCHIMEVRFNDDEGKTFW